VENLGWDFPTVYFFGSIVVFMDLWKSIVHEGVGCLGFSFFCSFYHRRWHGSKFLQEEETDHSTK